MNIRREQITYLKALQHLNPAHEYGSTFERGTRIVFGDREHFYLSGTASINRYGEVVHPGDIEKQTIRTIDNINALLSPYDITINDLAYLIIYIRNMNHYGFVEEIIKERVDKSVLPIYVNAAICRTSWLVEIEGAGIIPCSADFPVFL
jgi:enamine deaminase RidA (YjgF/YER057c/UK114 family)